MANNKAKIAAYMENGVLYYPISIFQAIIDPESRKTLKQVLAALATVANSGSYNDLTDKPDIPEPTIVDDTLSGSSTNPVQNKKVYEAFEGKVDKVNGKGLSQNDFTNDLKTKLEGLANYNDTAIAGRIKALEDWKAAMVGTSADNVINTFKEIEDFLASITGSETLSELLANLRTSIISEIEGKGYQDTTGVNNLIASALSGYAKTADLAAVATSGSYNDLGDKPTIPIVDNAISSTSTNPVQNKVVKTELDKKADADSVLSVGTVGTVEYDDVTSVIS